MIPYYAKDAGIKTHDSGDFYVVLDKVQVDELDPNVWNTFDAVKRECEEELKMFLDFGETFIALSPDGDGTYILNFIHKCSPSNGDLLL